MKKILAQLVVLVAAFVAIWFSLSKIDFVRLWHIKQIKEASVDAVGDKIWDALAISNTVIVSDSLQTALDSIKNRICSANHLAIPADSIKIHVVKNEEINAFALPANHLVIYSALIEDCKNPEELAGVMAHEIAHMTCNHVAKKMIKEYGLSVLLSSGGNTGAVLVKQLGKMLSSTAYDRKLESEADEYAVTYMANAHFDPNNLANFLVRMGKESELPQMAYLLSTHPNAKERAESIRQKRKYLFIAPSVPPPISDTYWKNLQRLVKQTE